MMTRAVGRSFMVLFLLMPLSVFGATRTWSGAVNQNWTNPGNWVGGVAPSPGDDLVFPGVNLTSINDYPIDTNFHSLTYNSNNIYHLSGNEFTLTAGIDASLAKQLYITNGIVLTATQTFVLPSLVATTQFDGAIKLGANNLNVPGGRLVMFNQPISGTGNLTLGGGNPLNDFFLNAVNTFTGTTNIGGTTQCNACVLPGAVVLNSGGLLGMGSGSIGGTVTFNGGRLGVSQPTPTGSLIGTAGGGSFGSVVAGPAAAQQGTANVTGSVTLTNITLVLTVNYASNPGDSYTLINNDGVDPVIGTFNNLPEGTTFVLGAKTYQITYVGGTGNDVVVRALGTNIATTTTLTVSPNPAVQTGAVTLSASVSGSGGINPTGGAVTFFDGATQIGTAPGTNGSTTLSFNTPGPHSITATYNAPPPFVNSTSAPTILNIVAVTPTLGTWALLLLATALIGVALLRRS